MDDDQSSDGGNRASAESINPNLGGKDIRFLQAVQEVNKRVGYRPGTDERPPATTGEIAAAADLNKNEVNYRFNQRGFDGDGQGYIKVYESELLPNGALSAKSAELTENGEAALADVLDSDPLSSPDVNGDLDDRLSDLEAEVDRLREENEALRETIHRVVESEMGAWSDDREEQFDAMLNAMIAYQRIFSEVFDIDVGEFQGDDEPSEKTILESRERLRESIGEVASC